MCKNEQTLAVPLWVADPEMIGAYVTVLPDGTQVLRGTLVPLEAVTRELYDGYKRVGLTPTVPYHRFKTAYEQSVSWYEGVTL